MQLARPEGLWLLGLLVPLALLYVLKSPRRKVRVSAVWLFRAAERDLLAKQPWKKLRRQVPLFLETLAIVMLALGASQPAVSGSDPLIKHLGIVLDVSASMQTVEPDGRTRLEDAKRAIAERLEALPSGAEALLIAAGKTARIISPLEKDKQKLLGHLAQIASVDSEGSLVQGVSLSASRLRQLSGEKKLLVVTDGALSDPRAITTAGIQTEILRVGSPQDNTGIVRVVTKSENQPERSSFLVHVFVSVKNHGGTVRNVFATLTQRNVAEPLAARQLQLAPGEQAPVVLSFEAARSDEGTGLSIELSPPDAFSLDDVAYATVPLVSRQPVILSPHDGSPWLKRALLADPEVDLRGASAEELETLKVPTGALIVYSGYCPESAPPSTYLVVAPKAGPCLVDEVSASAAPAQVTGWKETDPRLRFVSLGGLQISSARKIHTDSPDRILVHAPFGPIMTKQTLFGREGTVVGFDFGDSAWPRKASFVLFVRNIVEMARTARRGAETGGHPTGKPYRLAVPQDISTVRVQLPSGESRTLRALSGRALLPTVDQAGFYYFSWEGATPGSSLIAANLVEEKEGALSISEMPQFFPGRQTTPSSDSQIVDWSWALCALGLLFLLLDVWVVTRQPHITQGNAL